MTEKQISKKNSEIPVSGDELERENRELQTLLARERVINGMISDFTYSAEFIIEEGIVSFSQISGDSHSATGFSPAEIASKKWNEIVFDEDIRGYTSFISSLEKNEKENIEYRIKSRDGNQHWVRDYIFVEEADSDKILFIGSIQEITLQKDLETALRHSERNYRQLFENAGIPVIYLSDEGEIHLSNFRAAGLLKNNPYNIIGVNLSNFVTDDTHAFLLENVEEIFITEKGIEKEKFLIFPASSGWFICSFQPVKDQQGKVVSVQIVMMDITDKKNAEEAYHKLVDQSIQELFILQEGKIVFANMQALKNRGFSREELKNQTGSDLLEYIHPKERIKVKDHFSSFINEEREPGVLEFRIRMKDGATNWVRSLSTTIEYKGGKAVQIALIDISEWKNVEEKLNASKEKYRLLAEAVKDIILFHDIKGRILYVNQAAVEISGWSCQELLAKNVGEFLVDERLEKIRQSSKSEKKRKDGIYETRILNKAGKEYYLEVNSSLMKNEEGIKGILVVARDITEKKHQEEKINKYYQELKRINNQKDKYFSLLAHDLKSPFISLLGYSEFLANEVENLSQEEIREYASSINVSSRGIYNLLENLLQWSSFQTGRLDYSPENFVLNDILDEVFFLYYSYAVKKGINLKNNLHSGKIKAYADKNMVSTILRNLVSNAIKFTSKGGIVSISSSKAENNILLKVEDTGRGITEDKLDSLFTIEKSIASEGTEKEKGSGLGLVLCKEFIEKNNGEIFVKSVPGKGTSFEITIPIINDYP